MQQGRSPIEGNVRTMGIGTWNLQWNRTREPIIADPDVNRVEGSIATEGPRPRPGKRTLRKLVNAVGLGERADSCRPPKRPAEKRRQLQRPQWSRRSRDLSRRDMQAQRLRLEHHRL